MTLRLVDKEKLMAQEPTHLRSMQNDVGQDVHFYECPDDGDEASILAVIGEVAFDTGFYDLGDFEAGSDYTPVLVEGVPMCFYEMEK